MFIELHKAEDNEKIMLNIDKIQSICQRKGETYIYIGLSIFKVKESYENIAKCINRYNEYRK